MALSEKQKENTKRKFRFGRIVSYFRNMDPQTRTLIARVVGLVVGVFALFTIFSCVSYLFTWKSDYSIVSWGDISNPDKMPANSGSRLGLRWSRFLVGGCFGLSAFCIAGLLSVLAVKIFMQRLDSKFLRPSVLMITAAPLFSFVLSYFSRLVSSDTFFGGGLGGFAGAEFVRLCQNLSGKIGTGLFLAVLVVIWLLFASGKFAQWFAQIGTGRKKHKDSDEETAAVEAAEDVELPDDGTPLHEGATEGEQGNDDSVCEEVGRSGERRFAIRPDRTETYCGASGFWRRSF